MPSQSRLQSSQIRLQSFQSQLQPFQPGRMRLDAPADRSPPTENGLEWCVKTHPTSLQEKD
jgi:hypothetical protein